MRKVSRADEVVLHVAPSTGPASVLAPDAAPAGRARSADGGGAAAPRLRSILLALAVLVALAAVVRVFTPRVHDLRTRLVARRAARASSEDACFARLAGACRADDAAAAYAALAAWSRRRDAASIAELCREQPRLAACVAALEAALYGRGAGPWSGRALLDEATRVHAAATLHAHVTRGVPLPALNP